MKLKWNTVPGPTRALDIQADILTCLGYVIVPILASKATGSRPDHYRLYGPSVIDGEPHFIKACPSLKSAKDRARRHIDKHNPHRLRFEKTI